MVDSPEHSWGYCRTEPHRKTPLNRVGSLNKINHEINKFEQEDQRHPSVGELAEATNIPKKRENGSGTMADGHRVSIDAPFKDGGGELYA